MTGGAEMPRHSNVDLAIGQRIRSRRLLRGWSIRYAASRTGLSHTTWSRIERGLQAADNRFVLAEIAAALECAPIDLTGVLVPAADQRALAAQAGIRTLREALVRVDLAEPGDSASPRLAEPSRQLSLIRELRERCDYAATVGLLPGLLLHSHALARGPARQEALRLLCQACFLASSVLRALGHPAEAWLAAERCRDAAAATEDEVLIGYAAFSRACAALACGAYARGRTLAESGINLLDRVSAQPGAIETAGTLHLACGCACRALNRGADSRDHLAAAAEMGQRMGETKTLGLFFGPTNINLWRISLENEGGEPGHAASIAAVTNPQVLGASMRIVEFHAELARACARLRGRESDAVRQLMVAERVAPQHLHTSPIARETARHLLGRISSRSGVSALRGLCGRIGIDAG